MSETLMIQGKAITYKRATLELNECVLDPRNPRIQFLLGQRVNQATQNELDELIWAKDAVKALAQSIYQNGGVYEAIIVQKNTDGGYLVREGNCRTVSLRHLTKQYPGDQRFSVIPALVFEETLTDEILAILLADMHVSGKIRWDAYEQAKHVSDLHHQYGKTYEWLGNHLRLSKGKINELLLAYSATNEFLQKYSDPSNVRKFSFFYELMKKKELREQYKEDSSFRNRFHGWIADGKLSDAKQLRNLSNILGNQEAEKAFDRAGFEEASRVLVKNDPSLESDLFSAIKKATEELKKAPANEIQDLKGGNPQKIIMLRELIRAIEDLRTLGGLNL